MTKLLFLAATIASVSSAALASPAGQAVLDCCTAFAACCTQSLGCC